MFWVIDGKLVNKPKEKLFFSLQLSRHMVAVVKIVNHFFFSSSVEMLVKGFSYFL